MSSRRWDGNPQVFGGPQEVRGAVGEGWSDPGWVAEGGTVILRYSVDHMNGEVQWVKVGQVLGE